MAQNITLMGASYSDVPAVELPKTGGGISRFTDVTPTTATDSDVASGKVYFKADGSQSTGTASGGSATLITKNIMANGTYNASSDNADGYSSVTVAVPSKVVTGTFTGQTTDKGSAISISIPYTGSGYPVAGIIYATGGAFKSGGDIATLAKQYAIFICSFAKVDTSATPTYSGDTEANWAEIITEYKYSNSDATSTNYSRGHLQQFYYDSAARATAQAVVRFRSNTSMSVFIANTSYGFPDDIEFTYQIIYSS